MNKKILVLGGVQYHKAVEDIGTVVRNISYFKKNPNDFSLVLFTGGKSDVTPSYYGHLSPKNLCKNDKDRDLIETKIFRIAKNRKIKMAGIGRGAHLLNILSGGSLVHHLTSHRNTSHYVRAYYNNNMEFNVLSDHHQMMLPPKDGHVILWTVKPIARAFVGDNDKIIKDNKPEIDVEGVVMPSILSCGVQYHPELMSKTSEGFKFFSVMVQNLINNSMAEFLNIYA